MRGQIVPRRLRSSAAQAQIESLPVDRKFPAIAAAGPSRSAACSHISGAPTELRMSVTRRLSEVHGAPEIWEHAAERLGPAAAIAGNFRSTGQRFNLCLCRARSERRGTIWPRIRWHGHAHAGSRRGFQRVSRAGCSRAWSANWQAVMPESVMLGEKGWVELQFRIIARWPASRLAIRFWCVPPARSRSTARPFLLFALRIRLSRFPPRSPGPYIELRAIYLTIYRGDSESAVKPSRQQVLAAFCLLRLFSSSSFPRMAYPVSMNPVVSVLPLVVIVAPRHRGKSALGVSLAKGFDGEVVACDSTQLYRGFDIGTAKPTLAERDGVPHHCSIS